MNARPTAARLLLAAGLLLAPVAAAAEPAVGAFEPAGAAGVRGEWVRFSVETAAVRGFTVEGQELFDVEAERAPYGAATVARETHGARSVVRTPFFHLEALDVATGHLAIRSAGTLEFVLPPGTVATPSANGVEIERGTVRGLLFSANPLVVDGERVRAEEDARFVRRHETAGLGSPIAEAAAERRVGAVVHVATGPEGLRQAIVGYGDVTITPHVAEREVSFVIEGRGQEGRVLVFRVDPEILHGEDVRLELRFNGEPLVEAESLADALDPDDDGLDAEGWLTQDENLQLVLSIPHYSTHVLTLRAVPVETVFGVAAGLAAGAVAVALGGANLLRRR